MNRAVSSRGPATALPATPEELLVRSAAAGLALQASDGSMPPGSNGPWRQAETPLRNTGYWLSTFLHAHELTGEPAYRRASARAADYLALDQHRPGGAAFAHRIEARHGPANGLIGQAWTIEAMLTAADGLDREDLRTAAESVFLQHGFQWAVGLWETLEVDGRRRGLNLTFNQQVWFAAMAALLEAEPARRRAARFLNCLPRLLKTWRSGLIIHRLTVRGLLPVLFRHPGLSRRIWVRMRWPLAVRSIGYHSFVLAGLSLLHERLPHHPVWTGPAIRRSLAYARSPRYRAGLEGNPFAFGYNPTGLELAFALRELGGSSADEVGRWFHEQVERTFDGEAGLLVRGAPDEHTLAARAYEAGYLLARQALSPPAPSASRSAARGAPHWPPEPPPFVSVIVPVLDQPEALRSCLQCLEAQDYPPERLEVLVVDNGSQTVPHDVVDSFPRARLLHEPRPGSYAARNLGLAHARGEVIAFTDADCLPRPDWVRRGVEGLHPIHGAAVLAGRIELFARDPSRPNLAELYEMVLGFPQDVWVRRDGFGATANLMTQRAVVEAVGGFRAELRSGGDSDWCRRAQRVGYRLMYQPAMVIRHPARHSLRELIRRARRIAGGSVIAQRRRMPRLIRSQLRDLRPPRWAALRILADPRPSPRDQLRLIALAWLIRWVRVVERLRVYLGGEPLR